MNNALSVFLWVLASAVIVTIVANIPPSKPDQAVEYPPETINITCDNDVSITITAPEQSLDDIAALGIVMTRELCRNIT